jgi:hypothetical protein
MSVVDHKKYINYLSKQFIKTKPEVMNTTGISIIEEINALKTMSLKLYNRYISNIIIEEDDDIIKLNSCICVWIIYKYIIDDDEISIETICNLTNFDKQEIRKREINICETVDYKFRN